MSKTQLLTKDEIRHLAELAKLHLTDKEIEKYQNQLGETIEYVKNLNQLDTEKTTPTNSVVNLENITFKDGEKNERGLSQDEVLSNTKKKENGMFEVKKIM